MADLRIVDAPLIPKVDITGSEKIPTGGSGNYSISLDGVADYTKESLDLANKTDVQDSENEVKALIKQHTDNLNNPHTVTKDQIGLDNVDNTADADKPMSNSTQSAITTLDQKKADKTSVYTKTETNNLLSDKVSSVNGKTGTSITLTRSDLGISSDEVMQQWQKEARFVLDESGLNQQQVNDVTLRENKTYPNLLGSPVRFRLNPLMASFVYGINDPTHLDDNLNNFRGLNNPDAWHISNIAIGAVALGRNNAPFAYLSTALGHDCVSYGVASLVGGAGSATGNPDVPNDGANFGYCSFSWGKDTVAMGRISNAMGSLCRAGSRFSSVDGYKCVTGAQLEQVAGDVASEGASARAHGYESEAYGNFAFAYGTHLRARNGSQLIGRGINIGAMMSLSKQGLGLGYNVNIPTIFCQAGSGVVNGHAQVGFNTVNPISKYDFRLKGSEGVSYVIDDDSGSGVASIEVMGLMSNGSYGSLHNIVTTHPNSGTTLANVEYRLNSVPYLSIDTSRNASFSSAVGAGGGGFLVSGKRVVGGQLPAIVDLASNATLADTINKVNSILSALRLHGLIAT